MSKLEEELAFVNAQFDKEIRDRREKASEEWQLSMWKRRAEKISSKLMDLEPKNLSDEQLAAASELSDLFFQMVNEMTGPDCAKHIQELTDRVFG